MIARKASIVVLAQLEFVQTILDSLVTDAQLVTTALQDLKPRLLVRLALIQVLEVITNKVNVKNVSKACIVPLLDLYITLWFYAQQAVFVVIQLQQLRLLNNAQLVSTVLWDQSSNLPVPLVIIKIKLAKDRVNLVKSATTVHILLI
jgi:hypothetical protein